MNDDSEKQGLGTSVWVSGIGEFEIRYYPENALYYSDMPIKGKPSYNDLLENKQYIAKKLIDGLNRIYLAYEAEEKNES